jgi:nickel-dependent lactate racemase
MAVHAEKGGEKLSLSKDDLRALVEKSIAGTGKKLKKILLLPPDHTRLNSQAGLISAMIYEAYSKSVSIDIMPALGTHSPMGPRELKLMFGDSIPLSKFKTHDWRNDIVPKGVVPGSLIKEWSEGKVDYDVKVEANKILFENYDLVISIGQVVPHEVVGMANYTKNIMVGVGGSDTINKSHFLGAVYNMERIMGRADSPVRKLFNYGVSKFLGDVPFLYMLTVMARNPVSGGMEMRGFYSGDDESVFLKAASLSQKTNLELLDTPLDKVVVWLDPEEFKSTWLGNKAVYRTRMAIADKGELIVLAPGLKEFGEDKEIDRLIRKYGYKGTPSTLDSVKNNPELRNNLGAAAHLIHGSSEGRFTITYCPGPKVSKEEIEGVGFKFGDLASVTKKYNPEKLRDGMNTVDGEKVFYISNPALGLWALKKNFAKG